MITIYDPRGQPHGLAVEDCTITHMQDGMDTLAFDLPLDDPAAAYCEEEAVIEYGNRYRVTDRDEHSDPAQITCLVDLRDWDGRYWAAYSTASHTLRDHLQAIIPSGWQIDMGNYTATNSRVVSGDDNKAYEDMTGRTMLEKLSDAFDVNFSFDARRRIVTVVDPSKYAVSKAFLTDELNLRSIGMTGNSKDLVTRLYCYGKDGMTFADINGGKPYVEDFGYTDAVICGAWRDDRYTDKASLLQDARKKMQTMAYPVRSYECDVVSFGEFFLFQKVTLIDRVRRIRVPHQIVQYEEHIDHAKDKLTLSSLAPRIESYIRR